MQLEQIELTGLEPHDIHFDLFHDVHIYMQYVSARTIKRAYRGNTLPKSDLARLTTLMSFHEKNIAEKVPEDFDWIHFIDELAHKLQFTHYDTKGTYAGYSSSEATFSDNFIKVNTEKYEVFLSEPIHSQLNIILNTLISDYSASKHEFMETSVVGYLDHFSSYGCATGILPFIKFDQVRSFLFSLLNKLDPNIWYSTDSLVQYIKYNHRYFLIPENPKFKYKSDKGRYCNFTEHKGREYERLEIAEAEKDAFERVEGRYIERFLEYIPLLLGFVDTAYDFNKTTTRYPEKGKLKAFKIKSRMLDFFNQRLIEPKIIIQPNFEISIESEIYPAKSIYELTQIGKLDAYDKVSKIKIEKAKVIAKIATNPDFDLINYLKEMSTRALPQNVEMDLKEWINQGDAIVLYENAMLLESDYALDCVTEHAVIQINKNLSIVTSIDEIMPHLEQACAVPINVFHPTDGYQVLPKNYKTIFPKQGNELKKDLKKLIMTREIMIKVGFNAMDELNLIKNELFLRQIKLDIDEPGISIIMAKNDEAILKDVIQSLSHSHQVRFKEAKGK